MRCSTSLRASCRGAAYVGTLVAPFLLLTQLSLAYAVLPWSCKAGFHAAVHWVIGVSLVLALGMFAFSWRNLRRAFHGGNERAHFTALLAVLLSALVGLVIVVQWLTAFILPPCP
jgi:hypothetical protein